MDNRLESVRLWFNRIYLGGIPQLAPKDTAFLGFICTLTAIEALAGYRFAEEPKSGERFKSFVAEYFTHEYSELASDLWDFRNGMIHGFSPRRFALIEHQSHRHLRQDLSSGSKCLNFEDFYSALLQASNRYFAHLEGSPELQALCLKRIDSPHGGGIGVGPIEVAQSDASV